MIKIQEKEIYDGKKEIVYLKETIKSAYGRCYKEVKTK